jgi:uncharacterized OsmC-like protein
MNPADAPAPGTPAPSWSAHARWHGEGPVALACRGEALAALITRGVTLTPVEYLLLGAAGCFAMSLEGARRAQGLAEAALEVTAIGTKAPAAPSQLGALHLVVDIDGAIDAAAFPALVAAAKELCTVTNTLGATPTIAIARVPGSP